jgi:hypothetical protein
MVAINRKLLVRFSGRLGKCRTTTMGLISRIPPRKVINFVLAYRLRHAELKKKNQRGAIGWAATIADRHTGTDSSDCVSRAWLAMTCR